MKRIKLVILLPFFLSTVLLGQNPDQGMLDSLFTAIEANERGMGSIAVSKGGEVAYQRAFGYQDVSEREPATPKTKYGIGSVSKVFTAVLALNLIEEGVLSLDTKLGKYFPSLPNAEEITVEHLLRHRSGLYNFTDDEGYTTIMESEMSRQKLLELFAGYETDFAPGEKMSYSNTGYVVLSFLLEEASGQDYRQLLQRYITGPCGLEQTYLPQEAVGARAEEAHSYTKSNEGWSAATRTHPSIPVGAGAILSTPTDLVAFFDCLFSGQLISQPHLEEMTRMTDGYGLGISQFPFHGKTAYGHSGGIDGFNSMAAHFEEEGLSIAYLSNGAVLPVNDIMIGALSIAFDMPYEIPSFSPAIDVPVAWLERYEGTYGADGFPLDIRIFVEAGSLKAQATGQPAFPLEAFAEHHFRFEPAGVEIEFMPEQEKLLLKQGGVYELTKK